MKITSLVAFSLAAGLVIATEALRTEAASAQQPIDSASICGTWQSAPKSGGFFHNPSSNGVDRGASQESGAVKYTIHESVGREFKAAQSISMKKAVTFHMGGRYASESNRTLMGVSQGDAIFFAVENEPGFEKWLRLPDNSFDVIGLENGSHAMAYHYVVKQTARQSCK